MLIDDFLEKIKTSEGRSAIVDANLSQTEVTEFLPAFFNARFEAAGRKERPDNWEIQAIPWALDLAYARDLSEGVINGVTALRHINRSFKLKVLIVVSKTVLTEMVRRMTVDYEIKTGMAQAKFTKALYQTELDRLRAAMAFEYVVRVAVELHLGAQKDDLRLGQVQEMRNSVRLELPTLFSKLNVTPIKEVLGHILEGLTKAPWALGEEALVLLGAMIDAGHDEAAYLFRSVQREEFIKNI